MRVVRSLETKEGNGVRVRRAIPTQSVETVGPVIFLDHFGPIRFSAGQGDGAPEHPHRGFETLTYILQGSGRHQDSLGNDQSVGVGEAQWMRAGSGVLHAEGIGEATRRDGGEVEGLQFWINLPKGRKMSPPAYRYVGFGEIPEFRLGDASVRLLAGEIADERGPIMTFAAPLIAHVRFVSGGECSVPIVLDQCAVYVAKGELLVGGVTIAAGNLAIMDEESGCIGLTADGEVDAFVVGGPALDAPLARYGPFVMNTEAELAQAVADFNAGRFGAIPNA